MALTDEQKQKVVDWIDAKFPKGLTCPLCQSLDWLVSNDIVVPPVWQLHGIDLTKPSVPVVPFSCKNCGHVEFFDAIAIGLIKESLVPVEFLSRSTSESKQGAKAS